MSNLRTCTVNSIKILSGDLNIESTESEVVEESEWQVESTWKCTRVYIATPLDKTRIILSALVACKSPAWSQSP